jgi:hypothetical protein
MRSPKILPLFLATLAAIATAAQVIGTFPSQILDLSPAPNATPLRMIYRTETVAGLPQQIQDLMHYQYPLAVVVGLAAFGGVYCGLSPKIPLRWGAIWAMCRTSAHLLVFSNLVPDPNALDCSAQPMGAANVRDLLFGAEKLPVSASLGLRLVV